MVGCDYDRMSKTLSEKKQSKNTVKHSGKNLAGRCICSGRVLTIILLYPSREQCHVPPPTPGPLSNSVKSTSRCFGSSFWVIYTTIACASHDRLFDVNNDGEISHAELKKVLVFLGQDPRDEDIQVTNSNSDRY